MKARTFNKKLALNKNTVVNLDSTVMNSARGGYTVGPACNTDGVICKDTAKCTGIICDTYEDCTIEVC